MAKKCSVTKVYAPNGEPSKLYGDLLKQTESQSQALELWSLARTPEFVDLYGDWKSEEFSESNPDKLDENGEPKVEDLMRDEYLEDVVAMKEAKRSAENMQAASDRINEHKNKMEGILTRKIAELDRATTEGAKGLQKKLTTLKNNLRQLGWRATASSFAVSAKNNVGFAARRIESELKKENPNVALLTKYRNYLNAFDILNDLASEINGDPLMKESMQEELSNIYEVMGDKQAAVKKYNVFMENHVAEKLASHSKKYSASDIKAFLKKAPYDIKSAEMLASYAGDSKDAVVALAAKVINEQQQKTRKASIEFTRKLTDIIQNLEDERSEFKGNAEKLYDPMLERDSKGELTGFFITEEHNKPAYKAFKERYAGTAMEAFYDHFIGEYNRLNEFLPLKSRMEHRLPTLLKSVLERASGDGKLGQIKAYAKNKIEATNTDISTGEMTTETGEIVRSVPMHFTASYDSAVYNKEYKRLIKEGKSDSVAAKQATELAQADLPKNLSYDLGASLQAFQYMAENFNNMNEVVDTLDGVRDLVKSRDVAKTNSMGDQILSRMKGMDGEPVVIKGAESNALKMLDALYESQIYGMTEKELGSTAVLGMQVDHRKLLKGISSYNSMRMLGFNVLAGTANIMMGETMQWAEAFGGEYYSSKDYIKASKIYRKQLVDIMKDVSSRTPQSKIGLINEEYDVLGDYHPGGVGVDDSSAVRRSVKSGSLFFVNSVGEHMMQSRAMVAMMNTMKVYDAEGKSQGTLYDAHEAKDGRLSVKRGTYIKVKGELVKYGEPQKRELSRQAQSMLRRMHGNYNKQTAARWQRNGVLALVGQFRKWIGPGIERRFGSEQYNEFADQTLQGSYNTTWKFLKGLVNDMRQSQFDLSNSWDTLSDHQKANVKRTTFEAGMAVAMTAATILLSSAVSGLDEEEDKNKLRGLRTMMYLTNRLNLELRFFVNPLDAWQILKSPAASMSTLEQSATLLGMLIQPWSWEDTYEAGLNKDKNKLLHNAKKMVPLWNQVERLGSDGIKAQLQFFNLN